MKMSFTQRLLPARRGWTLRGRGLLLSLIGFFVPLFTVVTFAITHGATFTVTNPSDSAEVGSGSLRRAILDANATAGPDVIAFDAGLDDQTLTLTGGRLDITDDLTINGLGAARLTVNGSGRDIFRIPASRIAVALNGLTLENGGEAIEITGSRNILTVADATVIGTAVVRFRFPFGGDLFVPVPERPADDGIRIRGDFNRVSIINAVLVGNEENLQVGMRRTAMGSNNIIDVIDSTIRLASQNGIVIGGNNNTLTVQNSTISENGLLPANPNDGLDVNGAQNALRIQQVTISGNGEHGIDIGAPDNRVTLENSTITNSGMQGLIIQNMGATSTVFVKNTIIAGNRGGQEFDDVFTNGNDFISGGYNLVGNATGSRGFHGPGDIAGTGANPINARLGPLENPCGGTSTHAVLSGSPAINAGDPNFVPPPEFDQRGAGFFPRVQAGRLDIGAYESNFLRIPVPFGPDIFIPIPLIPPPPC